MCIRDSINTVPSRVRWRADEPVADVLRALQDRHIDLLDHHHVGLAAVQRAVGLGELVDSLVVFENTPLDREAIAEAGAAVGGGLTIDAVGVHDGTHYPVALVVVPGPELALRVDVTVALPGGVGAADLLGWLTTLLLDVAADPSAPVSARSLLAEPDRARLVDDAGTDHPVAPTTLAGRIADQVATSPDAVAVRAGEATLTYAELGARATSVARWLRDRGVGPLSLIHI